MTRKAFGRWLTGIVASAAMLVAATASAQTGMLKGKVTDAQGAPVDGAKVTVSAKSVKSVRELKTNKKGEFVQIGLFPGDYTITAEKGDLKASTDARIGIGENPDVNLQLRPAAGAMNPEQAAKAAALQKAFDDGVKASKTGNFDESIAKFNEALQLAPNCHDCYYNIGYANMQKKAWPEAEAAYKKAVELKPDYAEAWNGLANVYNLEKKTDLALEASQKAAQYSGGAAAGAGAGGGAAAGGGSAGSLYNQGVILWNGGKYAEAKEKFEAAAKADPNYADAHYRLGMANVNLGDMNGAVAAFENYLKAAPTGPHAEEVKGFLAAMKK
jgi:tetratricopeptide (TPR) repeat protein